MILPAWSPGHRAAAWHSCAAAASTSFVMCTLGLVIIGQAIAKNWVSLTRGDMGLSSIPKPDFELGPFLHRVR